MKSNIDILNWTAEASNFDTSISDNFFEHQPLTNSIILAEVDINSGIYDFKNKLYNTAFNICGVSKQMNSRTVGEKLNNPQFT